MSAVRTIVPLVAALSLALVASAAACSSDDRPAASGASSSSSSSGASGGGRDGSTDAATDGGDGGEGGVACGTLVPAKAKVMATYVAGTTPDDTGGTIADGTYDLTGLEVYLGTPEQGSADAGPVDGEENSAQATFTFTGGALVQAKESTTGGVLTPLAVVTAAARVEGGAFVTDQKCPGTISQSTPFTAAGTSVTFHVAQTRREIYTRRP